MKESKFSQMRQNRTWQILTGIVVIILIILMFMGFTVYNRERILQQNENYIRDSAIQTSERVSDILTESLNTLNTMAYLYEKNMTSPEVTMEDMKALAENSTFNYVEFTAKDGTSFRSDGFTHDGSKNEYYTYGIQGESGLMLTQDTNLDDDIYLTFYTPLHYENEIIGILRGICDVDEQLQPLLNLSFWGESASVFLCLQDGSIITGNHRSDLPENVLDYLELITNKKTYDEIVSSLESGRDTNFTFSGTFGISDAYITKLSDYDWFLVQFLPSAVTDSMVNDGVQAGIILEISLIAIFTIYIMFIIIRNFRQRRELLLENQEQDYIIKGIPRLFDRFVLVDLGENTYKFLQNTSPTESRIPKEGSYTSFAKYLTEFLGGEEETDTLRKNLSVPELQKNLTGDIPIRFEYRLRKDKETWAYLNIICLTKKDGVPTKLLFTRQDISEVKQEEIRNHIALQEAYHAAESANFAKREFLSRVSHDIRTPMNAIMGMTSIAEQHIDDPNRIQDCLNKIKVSSRHLLGLINEVLDMSKIESGKITLTEEEFNMSDVIDNLLTMFRGQLQKNNQILKVDVPEVEHPKLIGDSQRLSQILINIMGNAVKFTPSGGTISLTIREKESNVQQYTLFEFKIADTGIGMTPEFIEKIFEPFARAEDSRISKIEGSGLGMSIAKNIANMMNGDITVKSTPGQGSEFTVTVMLQPLATQEANLENLAGVRVLVVDDDPITCENASNILSNMGMKPEWVLSGEEAIARLSAEDSDFSTIIMDWKMPEKDGLETTREIRDKFGDSLPIIILSAYDWGEIEAEAREVGVNAFISKPLFKSRLINVLSSLLIEEKGTSTTDSDKQEPETETLSGRKVLLVEDIDLNSEIAIELLKTIDVEAIPVFNGQEAVDNLLSTPPDTYDAVLMDIQMPIMDGYEAAKTIRASEREDLKTIPIIAMTANAFAEDIQKALASGMNDHIAKPIEIGKLMNTLDRCLNPSTATGNKA